MSTKAISLFPLGFQVRPDMLSPLGCFSMATVPLVAVSQTTISPFVLEAARNLPQGETVTMDRDCWVGIEDQCISVGRHSVNTQTHTHTLLFPYSLYNLLSLSHLQYIYNNIHSLALSHAITHNIHTPVCLSPTAVTASSLS